MPLGLYQHHLFLRNRDGIRRRLLQREKRRPGSLPGRVRALFLGDLRQCLLPGAADADADARAALTAGVYRRGGRLLELHV